MVVTETHLFLTGVALFALCMLAFWRAAFRASVRWGLAGVLLPPSAVFFYAVFWTTRRTLALVHFASLLVLVLVSVLWVRAHPAALTGSPLAPVQDMLAPASRVLPLQTVHFVAEPDLQAFQRANPAGMIGRIDGDIRTFARTTFLDGTLRFQTDERLLSALEVTIPLHGMQWQPGENLLQFTPESTDNPPVLISRRTESPAAPDGTVYAHGFWLELVISPSSPLLYSGHVKLRLPDEQKSFVVGDFRAYTRDVRIVDDQVDRFYDSAATIEYVAEQYLVDRLGNKLGRVKGFQNTFFQVALENATASTEVQVEMADGSEQMLAFHLIKGSVGWVVESAPAAVHAPPAG